MRPDRHIRTGSQLFVCLRLLDLWLFERAHQVSLVLDHSLWLEPELPGDRHHHHHHTDLALALSQIGDVCGYFRQDNVRS